MGKVVTPTDTWTLIPNEVLSLRLLKQNKIHSMWTMHYVISFQLLKSKYVYNIAKENIQVFKAKNIVQNKTELRPIKAMKMKCLNPCNEHMIRILNLKLPSILNIVTKCSKSHHMRNELEPSTIINLQLWLDNIKPCIQKVTLLSYILLFFNEYLF